MKSVEDNIEAPSVATTSAGQLALIPDEGQELLLLLRQDSSSTQLVEGCEFLEAKVGALSLMKMLAGNVSVAEMKAIAEEKDIQNLLSEVLEHLSTQRSFDNPRGILGPTS